MSQHYTCFRYSTLFKDILVKYFMAQNYWQKIYKDKNIFFIQLSV